MENVLKLADKISETIKNSDTYIDYINAYNKIKKDPEIMKQVTQMKKQHIDFARSYKEGNHDFNREKHISQEFYKLLLNKDVETYFMNEHKLVKTISEVYDRIIGDNVLEVLE